MDAKASAEILKGGGRNGGRERHYRLSLSKKAEAWLCARSRGGRLRYRDHWGTVQGIDPQPINLPTTSVPQLLWSERARVCAFIQSSRLRCVFLLVSRVPSGRVLNLIIVFYRQYHQFFLELSSC